MANHHLVILKRPYLESILAHTKRIESRFSHRRRSFFGQISSGDRLFLKISGGPVCAVATVGLARNFTNLTPSRILELKSRYNRLICGTNDYWQSKSDCRFGVLVWLSDIRRIEPIRIDKKDWRAWVVLTKEKDFGLLRHF